MPPNVTALQAAHLGGGALNFAIVDTSNVQWAVDYVVEIASNPNFSGSEEVHFSPW